MIRMMHPMPTRGFVKAIAMLSTRLWRVVVDAAAKRVPPATPRSPRRTSRPPATTMPRDSQSVAYSPTTGSLPLASSEPSVGRPPVKAK